MYKDNGFSGTWAEAQALKDDLFRRARSGEITGEEADAEAERLGIGRLSAVPDPEQFDPIKEPNWTIPMAVAWIAYRYLDKVREWSAPYREACHDWHWSQWRIGFDGPIQEGWHLEQRSRPTLALLSLSATYDEVTTDHAIPVSIGHAKEALWSGLRDGLFAATGVDPTTRRRVVIPQLDWQELVPVEASGQKDEVRRGLLGEGYSDVLIPASALQGYWPPPTNPEARLPVSVPPAGEGYMPLYCAAQWIATKGATVDFDPNDTAIWRVAYDELLSAIAAERIRVIGTRDGFREPVPGHVFAGCDVDYPFSSSTFELLTGNHLYLRSFPYLDELHWRNGFDDALVRRHQEHWSRLMVDKADVRAKWPFPVADVDGLPTLSGYPGRPAKAKHLIEREFERRVSSGELATSLAEEAAFLLRWLRTAHPNHVPPTEQTIKNNIRNAYRRAKAPK